jgi:alpha-tubulin suppressor-like RCC1 family protein
MPDSLSSLFLSVFFLEREILRYPLIEAIGPAAGVEVVLFTRSAVTEFSQDRTLLLEMFLARRCLTDICGTEETCTEAGCVDQEIDVLKLQTIVPGKENDVIIKRDTTPPIITLQTQTPTVTASRSIRFDFDCNEPPCTFECQLDASEFTACRSPIVYESLTEGRHDFAVRGVDSSGVSSDGLATHQWMIDATDPVAEISSAPTLWSTDAQPVFTFNCNEAVCDFRCQLDNETSFPCSSPQMLDPLADGPHVFMVAAVDLAENSDLFPPAYFWNLDTIEPRVQFLSVPSTRTSSRSVSLSFVCDEPPCSYECAIDGQDATACSSPFNIANTGVGAHSLSVAAADRAGNVSTTTTASWTVMGEWQSVDSRDGSTCAIAHDQSLWCWGPNYRNELGDGTRESRPLPTQVGTDKNWMTVSMGEYYAPQGNQFACGTRTDGSLWCWGLITLEFPGTAYRFPIQLGANVNWVSISVGGPNACGISLGGELWCFGVFFSGTMPGYARSPIRFGTDSDWTSVHVSSRHACGIKSDQTLWCWGSNAYGTLGQGTASGEQIEPIEVLPGSTWKSISLASYRSCAINTDDQLWCWGRNVEGELGYGDQDDTVRVPTHMMITRSWKSVALRTRHSCAIAMDGTSWCWGNNYWGELATDQRGLIAEESQVGTDNDWQTITAGHAHTCALKADQTLWCWGHNVVGQLGNGLRGDRHVPTQVGSDLDWDSVSSGEHHSCAIKSSGELWCWGNNTNGQLGKVFPSTGLYSGFATVPVHIDSSPQVWRKIAAGTQYSCGIDNDGKLYCWGSNTDGRLGIGADMSTSATITVVRPQSRWQSVSTSRSFACAIDDGDQAWCWGKNDRGQLGNGSPLTATVPVPLATPPNWEVSSRIVQIAAGVEHACLVKDDASLWCWGTNDGIQNGPMDGSLTATVAIRDPNMMSQWAYVSAGRTYTCAIQNDNSLQCRGSNAYGMLGNGTTRSESDMTPVDDPSQWQMISASWYHICGIQTDESLWCWGKNSSGEIGDGTTERRTSPAEAGAGRSWRTVSSALHHSCAVSQDGSLWCWGRNVGGQLGNGILPFNHQATETRRP